MTNFSFSLENDISMALWKVASMFISPKGIFAYMNVSHGVIKDVFSWSFKYTMI
jgi:hypothetical protein